MFVQCQLDYCITAWFESLPKYLEQKLQVTQNKMVRFILNLSVRSQVGQRQLNMSNYLNIHDRVSQLRLNHVFKINKATSPLYLSEHFKPVNQVHNVSTRTRSNATSNYYVHSINSITSTSFYYNPIQDWNGLPNVLKQQAKLTSFKQYVKHHLANDALRKETSVFQS